MDISTKKSLKGTIEAGEECPVEIAIRVVGGRWKCPIIHHLLTGTKRFNELRKLIPAASQRMLTKHLRELEQDGIVLRKVYAEVPPKTEYSLTDVGESLEPVLWAMHDWATANFVLDADG
ncbi:winged helix-turn-helix transcriptional regulator [Leucothrix mucor]|uniref:winged helix-turn-helix transcriptional regulator n=1 Tax=Leucothrix mucor TaxID=45248 RepID=UPI0003B5EE08|nr:helix-turn-helix domain-containing protein [Leucothrix mucor]